jgi:prophage antirepressor-like protein
VDKKLILFENEGQQLEAMEIDGIVWFVANEAAGILGIQNPRPVIASFDDDEKLMYEIYTAGQKRSVNMISEAGLYKLIMLSRKPNAKEFKRWVTHEVLPSIRKTGSYQVKEMTRLEWIKACLKLEEDNLALAEQAKLDAPKVESYNKLMDSTGFLAVGDVGNILNIGRNMLFAKLRAMRVLMNNNRPYQKYVTAKWFVVKTIVTNGLNRTQTFVTPKGLDSIRKIVR